MAKKRKATAQSQEPLTGLGIDPKESRKRIRTYDDVANSEDDEFHNNQDEIRLGEDAAVKRRRKLAENEQFLEPSDEEVLGYSDEEESGADVDSGVAARDAVVSGSEDAEGGAEGDDGASEGDDGESEEEYRWGTSKAELYGADAIETEEQAREEEAEAIRLQKKQLQQMSAADYGFDEDEWHDKPSAKSSRETEGATVTEILPQLHIDPAMSSADRLKLLRSRYPEFEPLSKELLHLQDVHESLRQAAPSSAIARTRLRAASAYLGALIMYFSLITCPAASGVDGSVALPAHKLHDHPVMDSLVKCRELWSRVSLLQDSSLAADAVDEANADAASVGKESLATPAPVARLLPQTQKKKSRAERHADATREAAEQRKAERLRRIEAELADLDIAVRPTKRKCAKDASKHPTTDLDSDVGEEAELTAREAADQAQRKKSLRFYTSQIAQHANKRGTAGRNAGGDDDIPHRERLKDRQARLNAEAQKRGQRGSREGADVGLGAESDEDDGAHARQIRADAEEDDYYDMVVARAARKKDDRAALAEAHQQAALQGGRVVQEESVGADGKRKITYAIAKNKGLTPHRKKDVRNPRVKKRKKFDEKKKKLASIKPVYKGGEGRGGYGGELTGIKKGLVKSTKLS